MNHESDRRKFLKSGVGAAGVVATSLSFSKSFAAACGLTPPQAKGPFYPGESNFHTDNDLTQLPGHTQRAEGQIIYVRGQVKGSDCKPLATANVEIWQACQSGRYNNIKDPNQALLDVHFKYWGEADTDAQGRYIFKTIIPGAYPADVDWMRPPHLHFRVSKLGYRELVTQMYFKGHPLNDKDLILQDLAAAERDLVVIDFQSVGVDLEPGALIGTFDITMNRVRA